MKVLCVFGTRPEAIKMAPVVMELQRQKRNIRAVVCVTAQHREMLDSALGLFEIRADYDLDVMQENQQLSALTASVFTRVDAVIGQEKPDWVLVQGDTTTVMATALAAYYQRRKIGHVEAGLRTWDRFNPFPEEINRKVVDSVSDLHFAPTQTSRQNLLKEGFSDASIRVTGNTAIDALEYVAKKPYNERNGPLSTVPSAARLILVTAHRRENFGVPLENICLALKEVALLHRDVHLVYPVHLNPNVQKVVHRVLGNVRNIKLLKPVDYLTMVQLMKRAYLVLTDSGGLQEEMPTFGTPVLILRETTERPEAVEAGSARLVGTDPGKIVEMASRLLNDPKEYNVFSHFANPFGDGRASERIVRSILEFSD